MSVCYLARTRDTCSTARVETDIRLPNTEHESHAWRISEVAPDFRLEDVWALPVHGGAEDFPKLLEVMASLDPANAESRATRALFAIRYRIGEWLGWDETPLPLPIPKDAETTLSARLPEDLRDTAKGLELRSKDFTSLYRTDLEWAGEISNQTVHAVMHLGWAEQDAGPLSRPDGGLRQAPRKARDAVHGRDRAVPTSSRVSRPDASDRTGLEHPHDAPARDWHIHPAPSSLGTASQTTQRPRRRQHTQHLGRRGASRAQAAILTHEMSRAKTLGRRTSTSSSEPSGD